MKARVSTLILAGLIGSAAAAYFIPAAKVSGDLSKLTPTSAEWKKAKYVDVVLYPQLTIGFNDKAAEVAMKAAKPVKAKVAALVSDKEIALNLIWADKSNSKQTTTSNKSYGDGFAVQFPINLTDPAKLPYIGMGSEGRPVLVYLQKNAEPLTEPNGNIEHSLRPQSLNLFGDDLKKHQEEAAKSANPDYQRLFIAEGFRSTTEIRGEHNFVMQMHYTNGQWSGTLVRPLNDSHMKVGSVLPAAFAAWDGGMANRDGAKVLSKWIPIVITDDAAAKNAVAEINKQAKGDVKHGKKLADENCAACHIYPGSSAMANMAPNLSMIGGQATYGYLKESIRDPHAAIVPGYNRNAHPNTPWYNLEGGKRVSTMPAYDANMLDEKSVEDIITFLQTLK